MRKTLRVTSCGTVRNAILWNGVEGSKSLFVWTIEGQFPAFPAARSDNTHLSPEGAKAVAQLVVRQLPAALRNGSGR